jgi:hypothetical protein
MFAQRYHGAPVGPLETERASLLLLYLPLMFRESAALRPAGGRRSLLSLAPGAIENTIRAHGMVLLSGFARSCADHRLSDCASKIASRLAHFILNEGPKILLLVFPGGFAFLRSRRVFFIVFVIPSRPESRSGKRGSGR